MKTLFIITPASRYLESLGVPFFEESGVTTYYLPQAYFKGFNQKLVVKYLKAFIKSFDPQFKMFFANSELVDIFSPDDLEAPPQPKNLFEFYGK